MALMGSKTVDVKAFFNKEMAQELVEGAAIKGLRKLSEVILSKAKEQCPVLTGALQRSGTVQAKQKDKAVIISFNTPYALRQHEEHKSKSKYLERPFNEMVSQANYYAESAIADASIKLKEESMVKQAYRNAYGGNNGNT